MLTWCEQIEEAHTRFGQSEKAFIEDSLYRNSTSMCLFQICELAGHLSDEFRNTENEMPWPQIRGMRNLFAHNNGGMDTKAIWQTLRDDIPKIKCFVRKR